MGSPLPPLTASPAPMMPTKPKGTSARRERHGTKAHVHYQALLNERSATVIPTSLKVIPGTNDF